MLKFGVRLVCQLRHKGQETEQHTKNYQVLFSPQNKEESEV